MYMMRMFRSTLMALSSFQNYVTAVGLVYISQLSLWCGEILISETPSIQAKTSGNCETAAFVRRYCKLVERYHLLSVCSHRYPKRPSGRQFFRPLLPYSRNNMRSRSKLTIRPPARITPLASPGSNSVPNRKLYGITTRQNLHMRHESFYIHDVATATESEVGEQRA